MEEEAREAIDTNNDGERERETENESCMDDLHAITIGEWN